MKKRVLAGIRATGRLHLGNYLGAVKGMLALAETNEYETFYMVADMHAVTTPYEKEELKANRREVFVDYVAAGLDPEQNVLFLQSDVDLHAELAFYLSSVVTIARMQHLPTFKEKVKQYPQASTMALLNYPVLMAADILAYRAELVPVGIDQEPHLEVAREIARKMNDQYGLGFPEPQRFVTPGEYVPSLTGKGKMSKSVEGSYITMVDDLETIKKHLAKVPTDSGRGKILTEKDGRKYYFGFKPGVSENAEVHQGSDDESSGVRTLMELVELFQGSARRSEYDAQYAGTGGLRYGDLKKALAEAIFKDLQPFQERREALAAKPKEVEELIEEGARKAREVVQAILHEVKERMGLR